METKIIIIIFLLILSLNNVVAEIYKFDDILFYPNGSQYINLSRLYVGNLEKLLNSNSSELLEVRIIYKNQSFLILQFNKNITLDLPVENINISVKISATKIDRDTWKVIYTVINNYDKEVPINISFPPGYNLKNISTLVLGNSYISVHLYKRSASNTLYFGDSYISYRIPSKVELIYSPSIPFSIEKSNRIVNNSIQWIGNYSIYNNVNVSLKANIYLWVEVENKSVSLGNISNVSLPPNSTYIILRSIYSEDVPIFYLDMYVWNRTEREITVVPALKINNTYIIGTARVKGKVFYYSPVTLPDDRRKKPVKYEEEKKIPPEEYREEGSKEEKGKKPPEYKEKESPKEGKEEKEKPKETIERGKKKEDEKTYLIKEIYSPREVVLLSLSVFILNIVVVPLLPIYLSPNIVDDSRILVYTYRSSIRKVYIPYGIKLEDPLPLNITVVHPNDSLVSLISRSFNLPVNSAKALAIAIEHGGVLKTTNKKTYEIALKLGIDVEYFKI